jgi:hypothetical protein
MQLIDDALFTQLAEACTRMDDDQNKCPQCQSDMYLDKCEYHCLCGYVCSLWVECEPDKEDQMGGTIKLTSGNCKGRVYAINGTGPQLRKRVTMLQLIQNQSKSDINFPHDLFAAVANLYNTIQANYLEKCNKKFVHRGSIKDEILAALIKFECIKKKITRKNKDIAKFMQLQTTGFSRGEDIVRELHARGLIDIIVDEDPLIYVDRYLEALDLHNDENYDRYRSFIIDIVSFSELIKIGMSSQISSKIVGCLWILINKCKLSITLEMLEKKTDDIGKNTYIKFYKLVLYEIAKFVHIFNMYKIPYN